MIRSQLSGAVAPRPRRIARGKAQRRTITESGLAEDPQRAVADGAVAEDRSESVVRQSKPAVPQLYGEGVVAAT